MTTTQTVFPADTTTAGQCDELLIEHLDHAAEDAPALLSWCIEQG